MKKKEDPDIFPLSKEKSIKGSRRLLREKVIQILTSYEISETPWTAVFEHIFFRDFNFGDEEEQSGKLLTPDQISEIESDIPIIWDPEEIVYARNLIEYAIEHRGEIDEKISSIAANWEIERIAVIDKMIIHLAVTEILISSHVPVKVTLNEAIDLAKKFSTAKSGIFVNGVLDKFLELMKNEDIIHKEGKGLQE